MSLASISIKRPVFITSIVVLILIIGAFSLSRMGVDLFPNVSFPVISIQTVYAGASPNDVETLISKPIEDELGNLAGLKKLTSDNLESVSVVIAEFQLGTDIKFAEQQIHNRLSNLRHKLPTDIEDPVVRQIDPSSQSIMRIGVRSKLPMAELYDVVHDRIKNDLERVEGVGNVEIIGARKREIRVSVDPKKLQEREIPLLQVSQRLETVSKNVPVGKVDEHSQETVFRTVGEFTSLEMMKKVVINFLGSDRPVYLSDIAHVEDNLEEEKTRSSINGVPAVFLDIFKQTDSNTVKVSDGVKKALGRVNKELSDLKIDANLEMVRDGSHQIKINIDDVYESIIIGVTLCVVVVFFFLGSFRSTVITGLALPNSLLGAFILMFAMGFTVNIMTLLALSLAVGLLIDDAIVVRENIFRHIELGESAPVAAERGTNEVALAVIATTMVVMAVFGPIAFLNGIVGQFFREFGFTIVFAVAISLFDAMTVAPMLSAQWAGGGASHGGGGRGPLARVLKAFDDFQTWLEDVYEGLLKFTLKNPKTVLAVGFLIFVASLGLTAVIPKTFLPPADNGEFEVHLEMPPGTNLDGMGDITERIAKEIRADENVALTAEAIGTSEGEANKATIYVSLKPIKERKLKTGAVKEVLRTSFSKEFPPSGGLIVLVQDYDAFGAGERPFNFDILGNDLDVLSTYAGKVEERMKKIPGLVDVDTNYRKGKPEFQIIFDREKAESLGVSTGTAGQELRARVEGIVPAKYRINGEEYDIRVRLDDKERDLRKQFDGIVVPNVNYNMIPLRAIATGKESSGFSQINRQNKARIVRISADIGANGALGNIVEATKDIVTKDLPPPPGVTWEFSGQADNFQELIENMIVAVLFGVIFIYLVLASLYENFITPFTILLALPMAVCGALFALFVTGKGIDLFSIIGMIMLLGVVTKNSILLVDYTLQLSREGMTRNEALLKACRTRLRPILMTSIALIAGMIPIAVGLNEASSQRTSMGIALIGGLISSTFLTLLIVPAAFGYVDDFRALLTRLLNRVSGRADEGRQHEARAPEAHA